MHPAISRAGLGPPGGGAAGGGALSDAAGATGAAASPRVAPHAHFRLRDPPQASLTDLGLGATGSGQPGGGAGGVAGGPGGGGGLAAVGPLDGRGSLLTTAAGGTPPPLQQPGWPSQGLSSLLALPRALPRVLTTRAHCACHVSAPRVTRRRWRRR